MQKSNCYKCKHKRDVPGNAHISCVNPDVNMSGNAYGVENGWFLYPFLFDPTWMAKECCNFEEKVS